ncbi:MAG: TolC family protein [Deferrisomatales bacterium]
MMRWMAIALAVVLGSAPAALAGGGDLEALEQRVIQGPALADLVAYAYRTNPSIEAARQKWRATVEGYRVATAYPDPQLMVTYFPDPLETRLGPQEWNATLTQGIPFPGKLSKAGDLVEADARIARLSLDRAVRDVIVRLRESYHELLYIRQAKQVVAQNRDLLEHLRKVGETAYAQDRAQLLDVVKAQSQSAQLQYDAILLEELEQTERTRLNALLNRAPGAPIGPLADEPVRPLAYSLEELYSLAAENQEEIRIAGEEVARAEDNVELARYQNRPDFKVGLFYAGIGNPDVPVDPPDAGDDAVGVQVGLTIPLWFGKNSGRLERARSQVMAARARKAAVVNDAWSSIRALYFRLNNAERLIRLYRDELLPQAAQSLEISETWFREGEGSFSDFVETESVWYNFSLALARAKADYGKYLARLERLTGLSLTERAEPPAERGSEEGSR